MSVVAGIDAQSTDEVTTSLVTFGRRYTQRLYTEREVQSCEECPDTAGRSYAARFAAKEATLKILNVRETVPPWKAVEVLLVNNRFEIALHGLAAGLAKQRGIEYMFVTITQNAGVALAVVIAQANDEAVE